MSIGYLLLKYAITAALVVMASEIAKRSDKIGALILSLPLMTILTLFWLNTEKQAETKIASHAYYTFWYAIPTLPMFLVFPILLRKFGFPLAMFSLIFGGILCFIIFAVILRKFGISLF